MTIEATTALLNQLFAMAQQDPDGRVDFGQNERVAKYLQTLPGAHVSTFFSRDHASKKIVTDVCYKPTSKVSIYARCERPAIATEIQNSEARMYPTDTVRNLAFYTVPAPPEPILESMASSPQ